MIFESVPFTGELQNRVKNRMKRFLWIDIFILVVLLPFIADGIKIGIVIFQTYGVPIKGQSNDDISYETMLASAACVALIYLACRLNVTWQEYNTDYLVKITNARYKYRSSKNWISLISADNKLIVSSNTKYLMPDQADIVDHMDQYKDITILHTPLRRYIVDIKATKKSLDEEQSQ